MAVDWLHDADALWRSTGLGREEYVQKLLSTLVFGHAEHRWNEPAPPSERGKSYLDRLIGAHLPGMAIEDPRFVDEFELPRRHEDERAGWPDQAVITADSLVMIELKTERRSHRPDQLPHYFELAAHHHPGRTIALLYLTPPMEPAVPGPIPSGARYAHADWGDVAPVVGEIWEASPIGWERHLAEALSRWFDDIQEQVPPPSREVPETPAMREVPTSDAVDAVLARAAEVQRTGEQMGIEVWPGSPDLLEEVRLRVRDRLRDGEAADGVGITHVLPWLWAAGSSGGHAMSEVGRTHGYELRLSRYQKQIW